MKRRNGSRRETERGNWCFVNLPRLNETTIVGALEDVFQIRIPESTHDHQLSITFVITTISSHFSIPEHEKGSGPAVAGEDCVDEGSGSVSKEADRNGEESVRSGENDEGAESGNRGLDQEKQ